MVIPEIYPDEFGPGYLFRFARLNSQKDSKKAIDFIAQHFGLIEKKNLPAYLMARLLDMDLSEYLKNHTLLPVNRSVSIISDGEKHSSLENESAIQHFGHMHGINCLRVCKTCISEDKNRIGVSYYRKSHQFPGASKCSIHRNESLYKVIGDVDCSPNSIPLERLIECKQYGNGIIDRFNQIVELSSNAEFPVHPSKIIGMLQFKAFNLGVSATIVNSRELFSDYLLRNIPVEWTESINPTFKKKKMGKPLAGFDQVISSNFTRLKSVNYLLAMAVLFDDLREVAELFEHNDDSKINELPETFNGNTSLWLSKEMQNLFDRFSNNAKLIANELSIDVYRAYEGLRAAQHYQTYMR